MGKIAAAVLVATDMVDRPELGREIVIVIAMVVYRGTKLSPVQAMMIVIGVGGINSPETGCKRKKTFAPGPG